ncbi:MAG: nucleotidyltransferase domain-containing protein, partial [Acidimicrobiales bacterium]
PGARGRVLAALCRNTSEQTLRQLALSARVSTSRVGQVVEDLAELGIVERRTMPGSVLVRLTPSNVTSHLIRQLTDLRSPALAAMRREAGSITPAPVSLTAFGSFARGQAGRDSDVDVFAVRPREAAELEELWTDSLGAWVDAARRITGNPVHVIEVECSDIVPGSGRPTPPWLTDAMSHGVVLVGQPVQELLVRDPA